jgi:hypothetical protein
MARSPLFLGGLLGLPLASGLALVALGSRPHHRPVYSVAQVQAQLLRRPRTWTNRALLLRGVALTAGCPMDGTIGAWLGCPPPLQTVLADADPKVAVAPLPLAWAGPGPVLATVRRLPLLGDLPAPQVVDWGEVATYLVELRAMPDEVCGAATCFEALLLDAEP